MINVKVWIQPIFKIESQKVVLVNFWIVPYIGELIFNK